MVNPTSIVRLLSLPVLWMGIVQTIFGLLSFFVFQDNVGRAFIQPALFLYSWILSFLPVSDAGIWLLNSAMVLGRLEYFTILAMLSAGFWRY